MTHYAIKSQLRVLLQNSPTRGIIQIYICISKLQDQHQARTYHPSNSWQLPSQLSTHTCMLLPMRYRLSGRTYSCSTALQQWHKANSSGRPLMHDFNMLLCATHAPKAESGVCNKYAYKFPPQRCMKILGTKFMKYYLEPRRRRWRLRRLPLSPSPRAWW